MLDHTGIHLRAKFFDRHACADFFLQRQTPFRGVHNAQRFGMFDALGNRRQRHYQLVHHEAGIHSSAHERHAPFLRRGIEPGCEFRVRSKGVGQFLAGRDDAGLGFQASQQLIHHFG